jgi:hypothetical protein
MKLEMTFTALVYAASMFVCCADDASQLGSGDDGGPDDAGDAGDTDTGEDCGPQEITDDSTDLTWKRCHTGGVWQWSGSKCSCVGGLLNTMPWDVIDDACPDEGWRVPTVHELMGVLEGCEEWATIEAEGSGTCDNCPESEPCTTLFPGDGRMYWSATEASAAEAYTVWYNVGTINTIAKSTNYYVRCVSE